MNKVPESLRKSLYDYIEKNEEDIVENLLKQGFPEDKETDNEDSENK